MKRQKYISLLLVLFCLLGLLSACRTTGPGDTQPAQPDEPPRAESPAEPDTPAVQPDETPAVSPLPIGGTIDWNDIPDVWIGSGGSEPSAWLDSRIYTAASCLQMNDTYDNTQDGIQSLYVTNPSLSGLKDTALEKRINEWLQSATAELREMPNPLDRYLTEEVLACPTADLYTSISPNHFFSGNLLSISVLRTDMLHAYDEAAQELLESRVSTTSRYAVFDLRNGQQITLSDLFVDGTDLNALLNPMIASRLAATEGETDWSTFLNYGGLIRPFRGLPRDYPNFAVTDEHLLLDFPSNNPYMAENYTIYLPLEQLAPQLAQPMIDCTAFISDAVETFETFRGAPCIQNTADNYDLLYLFGDEAMGVRPYRLTDRLNRPAIEKVNEKLGDIFTALHDMPMPQPLLDAKAQPGSYSYASSALMANRAYIQFQVTGYVGRSGISPLYHTYARMFDTETGEAVPLGAVLTNREAALAQLADQGLHIDDPDTHYGWYCYGPDGEIYICAENGLSPVYTLRSGFFNADALE